MNLEFLKPNVGKIILTTMFVVSGFLFVSSTCAVFDAGSYPSPVYCLATGLVGLPVFLSIIVLVDIFGPSFVTMGYIVGIILSYILTLVLILIFGKIKSLIKK